MVGVEAPSTKDAKIMFVGGVVGKFKVGGRAHVN